MRRRSRAIPTRTWVAPWAMAGSKSPLMPIERPARPWRAASRREEREVGGGVRVGGRDRHQAEDREVVGRAAGGEEGVEGVGVDAGLLRLAAGVDLDEERRAGAAGLHRGAELAGEAVAVEAVDGVEELERAGELVRLQRADEVELECRGSGRGAAGQRPSASCTRFSPKTRWPAASTASTRSGGCSLETATSVDRIRRAAGARRVRRRCGRGCPGAAWRDRRGMAATAIGAGEDPAVPSELHADAEVGDRRALVVGRRDRVAVGDAAVDRRAAAEVVLRREAVGVVAVEDRRSRPGRRRSAPCRRRRRPRRRRSCRSRRGAGRRPRPCRRPRCRSSAWCRSTPKAEGVVLALQADRPLLAVGDDALDRHARRSTTRLPSASSTQDGSGIASATKDGKL